MKTHRNSIAMIAVVLLVIGAGIAAAQEVTLYNFKGSNSSDGSVPEGNLVMDAAGNMYGITTSGGVVGEPYDIYGTVYELSPAGAGAWTEKVIWNFGATSTDGTAPAAGLVFDSKGNLYGTTSQGGTYGGGTVYELSPGSGGTWTEKVLYSFGAVTNDGTEPRGGSLIFDAKGNLYGTTFLGGPNTVSDGAGVQTAGTVFELSPGSGGTWTEKILYNFGANSSDGANSVAGLAFDAAGNLYGTTEYGGSANGGTAFILSPQSGGTWKETVIHDFSDNGTDGDLPQAGVILDAQGNLYGTAYGGGSNPYSGGLGAVYELSPAGNGTWSEQILYSFNAIPGIGEYPLDTLTFDAAGNLYGTASLELYGFGQVFELSPGPNGWTETTLYHFGDTPDGWWPAGGVIFDANGNLYGTCSTGGSESADFGLGGTVWEIPNVVVANPIFTPAAGAYTGTQMVKITDTTANAAVYYSINGGEFTQYSSEIAVSESETIQAIALNGTVPPSQVVTANYQIGTTAAAPVFSIGSGTYTEAQTVTLTDAAPDATIYYTTNGVPPTTSSTRYTGAITVSASETIEAFAVAAGYANSPVVSEDYDINPVNPPTEATIFSFAWDSYNNPIGGNPHSNLIADAKGNLYGTAATGGMAGTTGSGIAFELSPASGGAWNETVLYAFGTNSGDGTGPISGLVFDKAGNLYGTTPSGGANGFGTVYELSPGTGGWTEKTLYSFGVSLADPKNPKAGLVFDTKGNLYGTTEYGGTTDTTYGGGYGAVFELSPGSGGTWTESVLYNFNNLSQTDGIYPLAGLVFDTKGNLYGTTSAGGSGQDSEGGGTVFKLSPSSGGTWTETVLRNFGGCAEFCVDGYLPLAGLAIDAAGNLYGTTSAGGPNGYGADGMAFELSPGSGGVWTEKVLHNFGAYETDGAQPYAGLVFDPAGNLYGTTNSGGLSNSGTVFELTPEESGGWSETILHNFQANSADGTNPAASVYLDAAGNVYGTTVSSGSGLGGTAFKVASITTALPAFSLPGGSYAGAQMISLSDATSGSTIYYTTNGDVPTSASAKYSAAIPVTAPETIKAIAVTTGLEQSGVATASYTIVPAVPATLASPASGSTLTGPSVAFKWNAATDAAGYSLLIGSTGVGSSNLYSSAETTATAYTFATMPTNGETIYVRLITNFDGTQGQVDYTFTAATQAAISSPAAGATLSGPSETFSWSAGVGVTGYYFQIGSKGQGSNNLYNSPLMTTTSYTFTAMPTNGETIYVRLFSSFNGAETHVDYTYTAATQAAISSPAAGAILAGPSVTFKWTAGVGVNGYYFQIGSKGAGSNNLYNSPLVTTTSYTFTATPTNGETIYVRLFSVFATGKVITDYTYTAGTNAAVTSPAAGSTLAGPSVTFNWTKGVGVSGYYFQIGTKGAGSNNLYNSPLMTATTYTFTTMPVNGETINVRLFSVFAGGKVTEDYTYTAATQAAMTSPAAGITFAKPAATFEWTAGVGVTGYYLLIGSTGAGSSNLYSSPELTTTSYAFTGMPATGETLNVRLISSFNGVESYADYTYTAPTQGAITSPAPGSTLGGASVTFNWSAGIGVTGYYLQIGSKGAGSNNLYNSALTTGTSYTFTAMPTNGETIYVRLISSFGGAESHADYTYTAQ